MNLAWFLPYRTLQMSGYFGMPIKYDRPLTPDQIFIGAILVDILQLLRYNTHSVLEFVVSMYIYM